MKEILLTQGKVALVDDEDFDRVNQFKWHTLKADRRVYAVRNVRLFEGRRKEYLHAFILGTKWVDHRDGDGQNNQRQNLRPASAQQNQQAFRRKAVRATSKYRGVDWDQTRKKWSSRVKIGGRSRYLGRFTVEEDAARAYDKAAIELFGEFASPNFKQTS